MKKDKTIKDELFCEVLSGLNMWCIKNLNRGIDLNSANLRLANLRYANLRLSDLRFADIHYADLRYANLYSADIDSANLCSANFRLANLRYANLRLSDLSYADIFSANFHSADISCANFEGANLKNIKINSISYNLLNFNLGELSDKLTLELMRRNCDSFPNPELFDIWANGGECPYNNINCKRLFKFKEKRELWKKGKPEVSMYELFMSIAKEKGWQVKL